MDINIHIAQLKGFNGNNVYDVALQDLNGQTISVLACSEENAHAFAEKVKDLIDEHTIVHVNDITRNY
jgi:hypothetical protein